MIDYEGLGVFYLGGLREPGGGGPGGPLLYDAKDLVTHAVCVGMTGSGKTGLCIALLEEAALDGIPALVIDPKGDLGNLLLTFPDLRPDDFAPWVDEDGARREGLDVAAYAAREAARWREGLAAWGQDPGRLRRLRDAADFTIYTPGSEAGLPVSILASFAAPPAAARDDPDLFQERVATTTASLLGLLKIDADPIRSREHILIANLLDHAWRRGLDLDLGGLIRFIQTPPLDRLGVLELEAFFPAKDRFDLALRLNSLLAAPGFQSWLAGEPLDPQRLLHGPAGKPRVAIFSIAHLADAERMFFVSLLLNQVLGWMRAQPGTTSLRAILYMDEIFGYIPPVAEPPSKRLFLTLLKQARAFGLGLVLSTQNPVDLDYKGLSNAGTWFVGRLQTERDKERVLEGLIGASGGRLERAALDRTLAELGKRRFLMHDVHEDAPVVFESRWALSYLCGPLTRQQIRLLMRDRAAETAAAPAPAASPPAAAPAPAVSPPPAAPAPAAAQSGLPVLPPEIPQVFLPLGVAAPEVVYAPALLGLARIEFASRRDRQSILTQELALLLPLAPGRPPLDWREAAETRLAERDLAAEPRAAAASFLPLPPEASLPASYRRWQAELADWLYRNRSCDLFESRGLGLTSEPGESERDFRVRLAQRAREERDRAVEELRRRHAGKAASLEERLRLARQRLDRERGQAAERKLETAMSIGATVFAVLAGRRRVSSSTLGRATRGVRGVGRSAREAQDVERAQETVEVLARDLDTLPAELAAETKRLSHRYDPQAEPLATRSLRPRRADVVVRRLALAWAPHRREPSGALVPAWT